VREDNALFKAELPEEIASPKSPGKRSADEMLSDGEEPAQRWNPIQESEDKEGDESHQVIMGIEPTEQEMQEVPGGLLIANGAKDKESMTIDRMDMDVDHIMEQNKPRHVEFAE
jgi:hypothetical protein